MTLVKKFCGWLAFNLIIKVVFAAVVVFGIFYAIGIDDPVEIIEIMGNIGVVVTDVIENLGSMISNIIEAFS